MATVLIQCRRGTESEWAASNPILAAGEFGYTSDTGKTKIGNGASQWSALPYATTDLSTLATSQALEDAVSISASKVSLGSAVDAITELANTRATQVSLGNVQSQLTDVIGDAPAAIDTIHELADALKDNEDVLDLYATQVSLGNTNDAVALKATKVSLGNTDAAVALKAPIDDPTFTTGITTPKIDIQSNGTIQGKDIVGNNTLRLRTIGGSDLSIDPEGAGIVQVSTDINLASGKEYKVNGVPLSTGGGITWEEKTSSFDAEAGKGYFIDTSSYATNAVVAGHVTSAVNGKYEVNGTYDGSPKYEHKDGTYVLYKSGTVWTVESGTVPTNGSIEMESATDDEALPWDADWSGASGPTVTEGTANLEIDMPSASLGDEVYLVNHASTWDADAVRVNWNAKFNGVVTSYTEWGAASTGDPTDKGSICFVFAGATVGWVIKSTTISTNHIT